MYNYYDLIKAVETLIDVVTSQGNRLFLVSILIFIILTFSVFRRKEHI